MGSRSPALSPPRLCFSSAFPIALQHRRLPEWEGAAVPPPRPFLPRPPAPGRWAFHARTDYAADGRGSQLPAAGIPRVGVGPRPVLRGGEEREEEEGEETDHSRER